MIIRILEYAIAAVVIPIFFFVIGALIVAALQWFFTETLPSSGLLSPKPKGTKRLRHPIWERIRAWYYGYQIDRLAADIERKLERKQRRAEEWQRNHRL